jgi:diguanylate cyclase (GGDEF)-like protein
LDRHKAGTVVVFGAPTLPPTEAIDQLSSYAGNRALTRNDGAAVHGPFRIARRPVPTPHSRNENLMSTGIVEARSGGDWLAAAVLDALPDATAVLDATGTIVGVNHTWRMFAIDNGGRPEATGPGINYLQVCTRSAAAGCQDAADVAAGLRAVLAGDTVEAELEYPCPSPAAGRWFLLRITPLAGPTPGAVVSHVNITRRKTAEQTLAHEAAHDPLTGLANRTLFTDRLTAALTPRPGRPARGAVGVLYLDLDGFKPVNDTHGHAAGDEVLLATAHRLRAAIGPQDTAARLGGDEFAVIAPRITATGLTGLATRISNALADPHLIHGHRIAVPASVGSHLATPGDPATDVVHRADQAMYAVKAARPAHRRPPDPAGPAQ